MTTFSGLYLDHNATSPLRPEVREKMLETLGFPGNASAVHKAGRQARRLVEDSRATILKALNAGPRDVLVFTSGATEANNLVLQGVNIERVIVSSIEHPSVLNVRKDVQIIPCLPSGLIDLAALEKMLDGNTQQTLISVMMVNNETGVIQPVADIVKLARKHGCLVHTDAVQAFGRIPVDIQALGVDFLSLSAHKIGGPQGVGCLINANCNALAPLILGGGQEKNMRAGTENVAGICGFSKAVELCDVAGFQTLSVLRDKIEEELQTIAADIVIYGKNAPRVANTCMFAIKGISSETQLIALDLAGVCVSNGSACTSGSVKSSHVLLAMGAGEDMAQSAIRVSLGWSSTPEDVLGFVTEYKKIYERVKK